MTNLFTFLTSTASTLLGNWKSIAVSLALGAAGGSFGTYKIMHNANLAAETKQAIATVQLTTKEADINYSLGQTYLPQFIVIASETQRRESEITQHVTPQIDHDFPVPLGFVRVFNDAAHGAIPPASAGSDADPSGVPLSDVAHAHTADEGTLDVCRTQLSEWWDWYDKQSVVFNKANGK